MTFRFVSNVDGADFTEATHDLDAGETLFVVSSKTFTTLETMTNAATARTWLVDKLGSRGRGRQALRRACPPTREAVRNSASTPPNMFGFWDWVGGRYSMDSAIGLSTMIAIGADNFRDMLAGFHAMDEHFRTAPPERNLPLLMGLLTVWYNNFFGAQTHRRHAVFAASRRASRPTCSSCRWRATASTSISRATRVDCQTGPIIWGEPGTDGQHSFYQLHPPGHEAGPLRLHRLLPSR